MNGSDKPLLATGKIVSDYRPLKEYWGLVKKVGKDNDFIKREYLDYLESFLNQLEADARGSREIILRKILDKLESYIEKDIDEDLAARALENCCIGGKLDNIQAKKIIARIIAGYLLEYLDSLGKIRIKIK